ncbi:MAG: NADPH-dependent glutamate synthase [Bacteroidetes bacterium]|nr:NADPH-dependent glutamate synthase [Bacteroidota bacterium]
MKIPRAKSAEQDAHERACNFLEVALGFSVEQALSEATRCLECKDPVCMTGCPVNVDIRSFLQLMMVEDYAGAVRKIRESNYLPAICGRVCPQETQCEAVCTMGKKHEPVAIGKLERFVADYESLRGLFVPPAGAPQRAEKVAIVGSGPSGLTCAAELAQKGYQVTVFEALHEVGGVLRYGIPEFRLPRTVLDMEIGRVKDLGVEILTNFVVGMTATLDELMDTWGFSAIYLGTGAGSPSFMEIPGEGLIGVYSANEFLTRVNLMRAYAFPDTDTPVRIGKHVAVIGGGNTAMDAVRTSLRLGAEKAYLVYRRSRTEMPARDEEIHHAEEEGVEFLLLTNPLRILGNEKHEVRGMECQRMELGEPDSSGRRKPVPIPGSEFVLEVETVIEAVGQSPNPIVQSTTPGLKTGRKGVVEVGEKQETSRRGVFAGGDLSRGGATVILAMKDGKTAAAAIDEYLNGKRDLVVVAPETAVPQTARS